MDGKLGLEALQEFIAVAYENNQIQQKFDVRTLIDYSPLFFISSPALLTKLQSAISDRATFPLLLRAS